jgi:hypothetical protein
MKTQNPYHKKCNVIYLVIYMFRLGFWDDVEDIYEVDMSCVKPYASECLVNHVNVHQVEPQSIMAHATEICHLDLHSILREDLENVKVKVGGFT